MADQPPGINQAGLDIFMLQPGVCLQNNLRSIPGRQHIQHMFHREPAAANDGFPPENLRIYRDTY